MPDIRQLSPSVVNKIPAGEVCTTPVSGVDLVPTFYNFAGLELPWKMHGHDLTPLLTDPKAAWNHPVLATLTGRKYGSDTDNVPADPNEHMLNGVPWWISLVKGHTKYIRTLVEGEVEELYDLDADPDELHNLAVNPKNAKRLEEFRQALIDELRRTDAGIVENLPSVKQVTK